MTETGRQKSSSSRLQSIDVLRGVAILLVFLNHLEPRTVTLDATAPGGLLTFIYWRIKNIGWTGVDLFFVLSGFLISGLLFREMERTDSLNCWRFWLRRGFKIWPSYYLLLVVLAVTGITNYIDYSSVQDAVLSILSHALFVQNYLVDNPNGPTWSLAVEEHFYILLPLVLMGVMWLSRKTGKNWKAYIPGVAVAFMVVCLALRVRQAFVGIGQDDFMKTHFRMDALMFGVFTSYLCMTGSRLITWIQSHRVISMAISVVCVAPSMWLARFEPLMFTVGFSLLSVGYAIMLVLMYGGLAQTIQSTWALRSVSQVGVWSYNIYLWHFFIIDFAFYKWFRESLIATTGTPFVLVLGQGILFVGSGILMGYLATKIVEDPFLRLRNRLLPSSFGIPAPAATEQTTKKEAAE